jgi:hypothetical protein
MEKFEQNKALKDNELTASFCQSAGQEGPFSNQFADGLRQIMQFIVRFFQKI